MEFVIKMFIIILISLYPSHNFNKIYKQRAESGWYLKDHGCISPQELQKTSSRQIIK